MRGVEPLARRIISVLEGVPRWVLYAVGGVAWFAVLLADLVTPPEVDVAFFYLFPIFVFTWFAGRRTGLLSAVACGMAYLGANVLERTYVVPAVRYWNAFLQLGSFVTFSFLAYELKRLADHEKFLARTDALTGATNLRGLRERAGVEIARLRRDAGPLTLALIDVDDFKKINDSFGHAVGDSVLAGVVARLEKVVRGAVVVARIGGDEFALLLPDTSSQDASSLSPRLREALSGVTADGSNPIRFSMGMVTFIQAPPSLDAMMREVDELLYSVKSNGKNGLRLGVSPPPEARSLEARKA